MNLDNGRNDVLSMCKQFDLFKFRHEKRPSAKHMTSFAQSCVLLFLVFFAIFAEPFKNPKAGTKFAQEEKMMILYVNTA